jgi:hypothetical protein
MITNASPHTWVEGDRSQRDATTVVSDSTDQILMADVNFTPAQPRVKDAGDPQTLSDHLEMVGLFNNNKNTGSDGKIQTLESEAMRAYRSQDQKIFDVPSGPFAGMKVPEALRCAIFQSNLAVKAGLIRPGEVTVRAIEFGNLMASKGYKQEGFVPGKSYPDGTYIVGAGGGSDGDKNHVGLVLSGKLMHTHAGRINYESISNKFRRGAYDEMRVYIPPGSKVADHTI